MTVRLPDGGVERIFYTGDTPPQVTFPAPSPVAYAADPFVIMQRISAEMDRESAAMMGQADAMMVDPMATAPLGTPDRLMTVNLGDLPAGARGYSFVSTMSGNGVCSRSVQITSRGDGAKPTVVTHTSGDCAAVPADHPPTRALDTRPAPASNLTEAAWRAAPSATPRLQPVSAQVD